MKKVLISIFLALVLILSVGGGVLADSADVAVSDLLVTGTWETGTEVTVSGTVTVTAEADSNCPYYGWIDHANACSYSAFDVVDPDGVAVGMDDSKSSCSVEVIPMTGASADASKIYSWSYTFTVQKEGEYAIRRYGSAETESWAVNVWWPWLKYGYEYDFQDDSKSDVFTGWYYDYYKEYINVGIAMGESKMFRFDSGSVLLDPVEVIGYIGGGCYKLNIPVGTRITSIYLPRVSCIFLKDVVDDVPQIASSLDFSQPCTLSKLDGKVVWNGVQMVPEGKWIVVSTFRHVDNCLK